MVRAIPPPIMDVPGLVAFVLLGFLNHAHGQGAGVPIAFNVMSPDGTGGIDVTFGDNLPGTGLAFNAFGNPGNTAATVDNTRESVSLGVKFTGQTGGQVRSDGRSQSQTDPEHATKSEVASIASGDVPAVNANFELSPPIPIPFNMNSPAQVNDPIQTGDKTSAVDTSSGVAVSFDQFGLDTSAGGEPRADHPAFAVNPSGSEHSSAGLASGPSPDLTDIPATGAVAVSIGADGPQLTSQDGLASVAGQDIIVVPPSSGSEMTQSASSTAVGDQTVHSSTKETQTGDVMSGNTNTVGPSSGQSNAGQGKQSKTTSGNDQSQQIAAIGEPVSSTAGTPSGMTSADPQPGTGSVNTVTGSGGLAVDMFAFDIPPGQSSQSVGEEVSPAVLSGASDQGLKDTAHSGVSLPDGRVTAESGVNLPDGRVASTGLAEGSATTQGNVGNAGGVQAESLGQSIPKNTDMADGVDPNIAGGAVADSSVAVVDADKTNVKINIADKGPQAMGEQFSQGQSEAASTVGNAASSGTASGTSGAIDAEVNQAAEVGLTEGAAQTGTTAGPQDSASGTMQAGSSAIAGDIGGQDILSAANTGTDIGSVTTGEAKLMTEQQGLPSEGKAGDVASDTVGVVIPEIGGSENKVGSTKTAVKSDQAVMEAAASLQGMEGPLVANVGGTRDTLGGVSGGAVGASTAGSPFVNSGFAVDMSATFPQQMAVTSDFQRNFDWSSMKLKGKDLLLEGPPRTSGPDVSKSNSKGSGLSGIAVDMTNNLPPPFGQPSFVDGSAQGNAGMTELSTAQTGQDPAAQFEQPSGQGSQYEQSWQAQRGQADLSGQTVPDPSAQTQQPSGQQIQFGQTAQDQSGQVGQVEIQTGQGQLQNDPAQLDTRPSVDFMTTFLAQGVNNIRRPPRVGMRESAMGGVPSAANGGPPVADQGGQPQNTGTIGPKKRELNPFEWRRLMTMVLGRQRAAEKWVQKVKEAQSVGSPIALPSGNTKFEAEPRTLTQDKRTNNVIGTVMDQTVNEAQPVDSPSVLPIDNTKFEADPSQLTQDKITKNVVGTMDLKPLDPPSNTQGETVATLGVQVPTGGLDPDILGIGPLVGSASGPPSAVNDASDTARTMKLLRLARILLRKARERLERAGNTDVKATSQLFGLRTITDRLSEQVTGTTAAASKPATDQSVNPGPPADVVVSLPPEETRQQPNTAGTTVDMGAVKIQGLGIAPHMFAGRFPMAAGMALPTNILQKLGRQTKQQQASTLQPEPPTVKKFECKKKRDRKSMIHYYEKVGDRGVRRRCPIGTSFDKATCDCTTRIAVSDNCLDVHMDFNNRKVEDLTPNQLPVANLNVEVTNQSSAYPGIAVFVGDGKLTVWRYQNYDFRNHIMLKLRFRPGLGGDPLQSLISNCDEDAKEPSVGIIYHMYKAELNMILRPVNQTKTVLTFNVDPNTWTDVTYKYDGQTFMGTANGVQKSKAVDGNVDVTDDALTLGYCSVYGYYNGAIDDVSIYRCIP